MNSTVVRNCTTKHNMVPAIPQWQQPRYIKTNQLKKSRNIIVTFSVIDFKVRNKAIPTSGLYLNSGLILPIIQYYFIPDFVFNGLPLTSGALIWDDLASQPGEAEVWKSVKISILSM